MKKISALLLALVIILGCILVSCKNNEKDNNSSDTSSKAYLNASSSIAKTEEDGSFTFAFDPYVLPTDVKEAIGGSLYYNKLVSAILKQEKSVAIPEGKIYDNVRFALGENFPFSALIEKLRYDAENKQVLISYTYEKSHDEKIEEFKKAVQNVFDESIVDNDDDILAAMLLYKWISENITITQNTFIVEDINSEENENNAESSYIAQTEDSIETNENVKTDIYNTLISKKGTAESVASLYDFLLLQLGIECKKVNSWTDSKTYYTWNMVQFDSKWYHCDIYSEQKSTEGAGLKFFGMTQDRVSEYTNSSDFFTGEWSWFTNEIPKANSKKFADFGAVSSWNVSDLRNQIEAYTDEFSRFVWEIK